MQREEASRFGFDSTAADVAAGIDLSGKTAVITGASGGLGAESARVLASRGAKVVIGARDVAKAEKVAAEIRTATGRSDAAEVAALELGSRSSIRTFAESVLISHPKIHILINNAGVMACPLQCIEHGYEMQLGTNHLGHFLLAGLLAPALRRAAPARVVCVSSSGHRFSTVHFDDPHYEKRPYDKWEAYGQSKTANIWHALELDRRMAPHGVHAVAIHPGAIMTELGRHLQPEDIKTLQARASGGGGIRWKQVPQGAATQVWAATAPELEGRGALYLEDSHVAGPSTDLNAQRGYAPWAFDREGAARLWPLSEQMVGAKFDLS